MSLVEIFHFWVPGGVVPLAVMGASWAYRHKKGRNQTVPADFILAVLIFDGGVVASSEAVQPFVRNVDLRAIIVGWHMTVAVIGGIIWWGIVTWGEPVLVEYYKTNRRDVFPFVSTALCWMAVFFLIVLHVGFFFVGTSAWLS